MNEQEKFWSGEFGDEYTDRNSNLAMIANNEIFFRRILMETGWLNVSGGLNLRVPEYSVIEFGANSGMNLKALRNLGFSVEKMAAVEINQTACAKLLELDLDKLFVCSMFDKEEFGQYDIVLSSGLLIHIGEDEIEQAYDVLYNACLPGGTIVLVEYFAASPTSVEYRGHKNKLWRRNYGKDMLNKYPDLRLIGYDFVADIDPVCPKDNVTAWVLVKRS